MDREQRYYKGAAIADILRIAGLNADLTTDMGDPKNAIYLVCLEDPDSEDLAEWPPPVTTTVSTLTTTWRSWRSNNA
jgi:hypothetical protein